LHVIACAEDETIQKNSGMAMHPKNSLPQGHNHHQPSLSWFRIHGRAIIANTASASPADYWGRPNLNILVQR